MSPLDQPGDAHYSHTPTRSPSSFALGSLLTLRLCMTLTRGSDVYRFVHPEYAGILSGHEPG
jgi:hypothetical protein